MISKSGEIIKKRAMPNRPARTANEAAKGIRTITRLNNPRLTVARTALVTLARDGEFPANRI
ncbi:hypothetical protein D1872_237960 [compost metagenome]